MTSVLSQTSALPLKEPDTAVLISQLCFSYPDRTDVINSLSLRIATGERVGLVGHNGCGKTTLFMTLCGALAPTAGEIWLYGEPVTPGQFHPQIGLLFQDPDDQLFSASVKDDIGFGPLNMGLAEDLIQTQVAAALSVTGIEHLSDRPPHHLSGGEKQMVAIAGLLAMQPHIVLYDEPTASLDIRSRRRLINFMRELEQTMLIASHDLEFVLEVCDRVVVMHQGEIVADGEPREIMGDEALMLAYELEKPHSLVPHVFPHHD
ncbi:MAG: energy-coupling factor ABC transporter ATP-binding protein [Leptolyngbya sp. SIO4C1]|nr:energy-coupling factor ABC transporter ATP-binding protein [Leptolyngbya sp. SIO4C1]